MKITIYNHKLQALENKIADFNKKLSKRNLPLITYTTSPERISVYDPEQLVIIDSEKSKTIDILRDIDITIPINEFHLIEGHKFVGYIQAINGQLFYFGAENLSKEIQNANGFRCDHCGIERYRNNGYVFEKDGQCKVIGSSCVNKYFPINIENELAPFARILNEIQTYFSEDRNESFSHSKRSNTDAVTFRLTVEIAGYILDKTGTYIKGNETPNTTRNQIEALFNTASDAKNRTLKELEELDKFRQWVKGNESYVKNVLEYFIQFIPTSDFEINIRSTMLAQTWSHIGFIAYGCFLYGKAAKRFAQVIEKESNFISQVGEKIEIKVKLLAIIPISYFSGRLGRELNQFILKFQDDNGNIIIWKTGAGGEWSDPNTNYKIKGRIKEHKDYNGKKETILTRCKLEPINE